MFENYFEKMLLTAKNLFKLSPPPLACSKEGSRLNGFCCPCFAAALL